MKRISKEQNKNKLNHKIYPKMNRKKMNKKSRK